MSRAAHGAKSAARANDVWDARTYEDSGEPSGIRRRPEIRGVRPKRRKSEPGTRAARRRAATPAVTAVPAVVDRAAPRLAKRLPFLAIAFAACGAYAVAAGADPLAPPVVGAWVSTSSIVLVAIMAATRLVYSSHAVAFTALVAITWAWAMARMPVDGLPSLSFAVAALVGGLVFSETRHALGYVGAVSCGFLAALGAAIVPEPLGATIDYATVTGSVVVAAVLRRG